MPPWLPGVCLGGGPPETAVCFVLIFSIDPSMLADDQSSFGVLDDSFSCSHLCGLLKREETKLDDRCWIFDGLKSCILGHKVVLYPSMVAYMCNPSIPGAEAGRWKVGSKIWQLLKSCPRKPTPQNNNNNSHKHKNLRTNSPFCCLWAVNLSCRN